MFNLTQGLEQIQRLGHILSQVLSQAFSLVLSPTLSQIQKRITSDLPPDTTLAENPTLVEVRPLIDNQRDLMIQLKWRTNMASYMMTWKLRRIFSSS